MRVQVARGVAVLAATVAVLPVVATAATSSDPGVSTICVSTQCPQPASVVAGDGPLALRLRFDNYTEGLTGALRWTVPDNPPGFTVPQTDSSTQRGFVTVDPASSGNCGAPNLTVSGRTIAVEISNCPAKERVQVIYENVFAPTVSATVPFPTTFTPQPLTYDYTGPPVTINPPSLIIRPATPDHLVFTQQPHSTTAGQVINPAVVVQTQDRFGNATPAAAAIVDVTLQGSSGGAPLHGTTSEAPVNGASTFADLVATTAGQGYRLRAAASHAIGATSVAFDVRPAAPDHLLFTQQPTNTAAWRVITPAVVVQVQDRFGNVAPTPGTTVGMTMLSRSGGASLHGATGEPAVNGSATFADLMADTSGQAYRLRATATGLVAAISDPFDVLRSDPLPHPAAPDHLVFTQQPTSTAAGEAISPAVVVQVQDRSGNVAPTPGATVEVTLLSPSGDPPLQGTTSVSAPLGVSGFADLAVRTAGRGYRLRATSGTLTAATSDAFGITAGTPSRLAFVSQPGGDATGGAPFPDQPRVAIEDAFGNRIDSDPTVVLGIAPGEGVAGARFSCSGGDSAPTVQGIAAFTGCAIDRGGAAYRLTATSDGVDPAESDAFRVGVLLPSTPGSGGVNWVLIAAVAGGGALLVALGVFIARVVGGDRTPVGRLPQFRAVPRNGPWELGLCEPDAAIVHSVRVGLRTGNTTLNMKEVRR
jgi:hypothetical protein